MKNIAKLREEAKAARKAAVEPFLEALAASGEVSLITIYGWTPAFNDGEPCEHCSDMFVNIEAAWREEVHNRDVGIEDNIPSELFEGLRPDRSYRDGVWATDESAEAHNEALCKKHGHIWNSPSNAIIEAISDVLFDTAEEQNGTDYFVTYILKDGKFDVYEGHYDCGY